MNLDFEKALTYIAKDSQWNSKLLAGSGLMLLSYIVLIFPLFAMIFENWLLTIILFGAALIVCLLAQCAILGYGCEAAQNIIKDKDEAQLPDWKNFRHLIFLGFKYSLGSVLFMLPVIVLYFAAAALVILMSLNSDSAATILSSTVLLFLIIGVCTILYFFILIFLPLFSTNFMKELKISSFVNFKQAFGLLKGHGLDYLVMYLLFLALACIVGTVATILVCTIIGIIFLPILYFYGYLVYANLCAQFINLPEKQEEPKIDAPVQE